MVDYSQRPIDVWGSFAQGMDVGGALRRRSQQDQYGQAYQQGGFEAVRDAAGGQGDLETAQGAGEIVSQQEENMRERAIENASILQRAHRSLATLDEPTRRERLAQMAPQLAQYGVDEATLSGLDTSDAGWATLGQSLEAAIGQFQEFEQVLNLGNGRSVGLRRDGTQVVISEGQQPWQTNGTTPYRVNQETGAVEYGQGEIPVRPSASGGGLGADQYSMMSPEEVAAEGLAPGSYQRNNATGQVAPLGRQRGQYTDGQTAAAQYAVRMNAADSTLIEMEDLGVDRLGVYAAAYGNGTEEERRVRQAQREFLNAILRRESGAVINPDEFASGEQQYFPVPGDTYAVVQQKREARRRSIQGLIAASQGFYEETYGPGSGLEVAPPRRIGGGAGAIVGAMGGGSSRGGGNIPEDPQPGTVEDGFRFRGGDPSDPNNWEPVG